MPQNTYTIAAFAERMGKFLKTGESTGTRAFVMETEKKSGKAVNIYAIPCWRKVLLGE